MRELALKNGGFTLVDDEDFECLSQYIWRKHTRGYVVRHISGPITIWMHREIKGLTRDDARLVDHINGNKLDNRRENLRVATKSQNCHNQGVQSTSTSGYKGVTWHSGRRVNKWIAQISFNGRRIHLGSFDDIHVAAHEYNKAAVKYHGEFARLNLVGFPFSVQATGANHD
jgi:hypothetical protein